MEERDNKDVLSNEVVNEAEEDVKDKTFVAQEDDEKNEARTDEGNTEETKQATEEETEENKAVKRDEEEQENVKELSEKVAQLTEENEKLLDRMMRIQAEYENYKRRTQKEREQARKYEAEALALEILPVLDNFERALKTEVTEENKGFYDGMKMIYNQLTEALKSQGIEPIETIDKEFDPNYHHAIMQTEEEGVASNIIVEELQKGYMLKDKVLRAAMVKVNK